MAVFRKERLNAETLLRRIVAAAPQLLDAQAQLGRLLVDSPEFLDWQARLPPDAVQHPEIWVTEGLWARQQGQLLAAARCFGEALRLYPDHQMACHHLAVVLNALGRKELAGLFAERAAKLELLQSLFSTVTDGPDIVRRIIETLEVLDRRWEAAAWSYVAFRSDENLVWAQRNIQRLAGGLGSVAELTHPVANPVARLELQRYPLPTWKSAAGAKVHAAPLANVPPCRVHFVDRAAEAGLNFRHYNGADPTGRRAYMFEYSGGGVGVLDYDGDGWPDIYLTQGCPWPLQPEQTQYRDRLFRNLGNGRLEDVTEAARLGDNGLSQGVTVGDYNNDGFPDLFVANIGASRFYQNNGDGTFRDITEQTGTATNLWGSSCVLADLNGDTLPDLYCVTYLAGPEVYEKVCETEGRPVQWRPTPSPRKRIAST